MGRHGLQSFFCIFIVIFFFGEGIYYFCYVFYLPLYQYLNLHQLLTGLDYLCFVTSSLKLFLLTDEPHDEEQRDHPAGHRRSN